MIDGVERCVIILLLAFTKIPRLNFRQRRTKVDYMAIADNGTSQHEKPKVGVWRIWFTHRFQTRLSL
jgi:hypothetical protein